MEHRGFEPLASTMRMLRAPNCANTPYQYYITYFFRRKEGGGPARPRIPVKSNKEKSTIIQHNSIYI